jgi:hypothetical protein
MISVALIAATFAVSGCFHPPPLHGPRRAKANELLLMDLITACRRIAILRDTTEIDEILERLREDCG